MTVTKSVTATFLIKCNLDSQSENMKREKGVVLLVVLAAIFMVTILVNIILGLTLSQSRLTHHQVNRIRAYYALQAGMNLAFDRLRTGDWDTTTTPYTLGKASCTVNDTDIPYVVSINITARNATGIRTINLTTDYTYTP